MVACAAYRHLRALFLAVTTAVLAEGPQCRIERRAGAGNPRRATDAGTCNRLLPCRLDLGTQRAVDALDASDHFAEVFKPIWHYAQIRGGPADLNIHGHREGVQASNRGLPWFRQYPNPHRSDLWSTEHRKAPALLQQLLSVTDASVNHVVHRGPLAPSRGSWRYGAKLAHLARDVGSRGLQPRDASNSSTADPPLGGGRRPPDVIRRAQPQRAIVTSRHVLDPWPRSRSKRCVPHHLECPEP